MAGTEKETVDGSGKTTQGGGGSKQIKTGGPGGAQADLTAEVTTTEGSGRQSTIRLC